MMNKDALKAMAMQQMGKRMRPGAPRPAGGMAPPMADGQFRKPPPALAAAAPAMKKGGKVKKMATGGKASQLSKANGIAVKGKTRGKIC